MEVMVDMAGQGSFLKFRRGALKLVAGDWFGWGTCGHALLQDETPDAGIDRVR
jgi:hypothetical protein